AGNGAQAHVMGALVRPEVGGLDLRHAADIVGHHVGRTLAAGLDDHDDPRDHHRRGEPDHQPHHRLAPGGRALLGGLVFFVSHHIGPKKLLSTVSRALPSALSITKVTSCRPRVSPGAGSSTGTESTCAASAETCRVPPRRLIAGLGDSTETRYSCAPSVLLTSLRV